MVCYCFQMLRVRETKEHTTQHPQQQSNGCKGSSSRTKNNLTLPHVPIYHVQLTCVAPIGVAVWCTGWPGRGVAAVRAVVLGTTHWFTHISMNTWTNTCSNIFITTILVLTSLYLHWWRQGKGKTRLKKCKKKPDLIELILRKPKE